jgi:hypothetical protein
MAQYYKRKGCPGLITLGEELVTTATVTHVAAALNTLTTIGTTADADNKFFITKYNATVSAGSMRLGIYGASRFYTGVTEYATVDRAAIAAVTPLGGSANNIIRTQTMSVETTASFSEISVREIIFP